jgi:hypothetical protein
MIVENPFDKHEEESRYLLFILCLRGIDEFSIWKESGPYTQFLGEVMQTGSKSSMKTEGKKSEDIEVKRYQFLRSRQFIC